MSEKASTQLYQGFFDLSRELIEALDAEQYISQETCDIINRFDRELEGLSPSISHECRDGCQYSKDVGMQEYSCSSRCQYLDRTPLTEPREVTQ